MSAPSRQSFIRQSSLLTPLKLLICKVFLVSGASVFAGPEGGTVTGGSGFITTSGSTTTIEQATDRMSIDWQSYNVNSDERVNYIQPDSSSVSLNRILSSQGSRIMGQIDANGHVILVNPNGIIFGKDSVINAGGILASGLSIDPDDFMNGDYTFKAIEGTDGVVINNGLLNASTGGSISLIGQRVENDGLISAKLGAVNLAAGKEVVVTFDDEGLLGVRVSKAILQDDIGIDPAIINSGDIKAEDGQILISASVSQDIFSEAVNTGGISRARSVVVHDDGSFTLGAGANVVNEGKISTSGENGGSIILLGENINSGGEVSADNFQGDSEAIVEIHSMDTTIISGQGTVSAHATKGVGGDIKLLGDKVGLKDSALVNASGQAGGGQVLIGGDQTGSNELIRNADFVFLGKETEIRANAIEKGNGGRVISFAENTARIYGSLSTEGGVFGGDGGFIETSGLKGFEIFTTPSVKAVNGKAGVWLIDPYNISIVDGDIGNSDYITSGSEFTANANGATIDLSVINGALSGGSTVVVQTADPASGDTQLGNIILETIWNLTSDDNDNTLVLNAHGDIIFNAGQNITNNSSTNGFNLTLNALFDGSSGDVTLNNSIITTGGGDITIDANNVTSTGILNTSGQTIAGDITINASDAVALNILSLKTTDNIATNISTVDIDADTITINGGISYDFVNLDFDADTSITFDNAYIDNNWHASSFSSDSESIGEINVSLNGGDILIHNASDFWLSGGNFVATGGNFTYGDSDDAYNLLATEGGKFLVGFEFNVDGEGDPIESDIQHSPLSGSFSNNFDDAFIFTTTWSNGQAGDIFISASGDVDLGVIEASNDERDWTDDSIPDTFWRLWDSNSSNTFTLDIRAGDDLVINNDIEFDKFTGTGTNNLYFSAGNNNSVLESDTSTHSRSGIYVNNQIGTSTSDSANILFGVTNASELVDFTNTSTFESNGGNIDIFVSGDVNVESDITTNRGAFTVGGTYDHDRDGGTTPNITVRPTSFDNYISDTGGEIDTSSDNGGGNVTITTVLDGTANGNVTIGDIFTHDSATSTSTLSTYGIGGNVVINSGNNVILQNGFNFNNTAGYDSGTSLFYTDRVLSIRAHNNITVNGEIYDSANAQADTLSVELIANDNTDSFASGTGSVDINADIYTAGGDFTAGGLNFNSVDYQLNTDEVRDGSNSFDSTTGGDVRLEMTGAVAVGNIIIEKDGTVGSIYASGTDFTFGERGSDLYSINSNGGNISLFMSGAVNIFDDIDTGGGDFTVGGDHDGDSGAATADIVAASFNNYFPFVDLDTGDPADNLDQDIGGLLNITSESKDGKLTILSSGDVYLGNITLGVDNDNGGDGSGEPNLRISHSVTGGSINSYGEVLFYTPNAGSELELTATSGNIVLDYYNDGTMSIFENGGSRQDHGEMDLILNAAGDITIGKTGQQRRLFLAGGDLVLNGNTVTIERPTRIVTEGGKVIGGGTHNGSNFVAGSPLTAFNNYGDIETYFGGNTGEVIIYTGDFTLGEQAVNDSLINTNGADVTLFATGDVNVYDTIATRGGAFTVGGDHDGDSGATTADIEASSFSNYFTAIPSGAEQDTGMIDTTSSTNAGNIKIYASGDIHLGDLEASASGRNASGGTNFSLDIQAGDDLFLWEQLSWDYLAGSGSNNTFRFAAGNSVTMNGADPDENGIYIYNHIESDGTNDIAHFTFESIDEGNPVNFTMGTDSVDRRLASGGGDVSIYVNGVLDAYIVDGFDTAGGDFVIGEMDGDNFNVLKTPSSISIKSSDRAIYTRDAGEVAGDVNIYSRGTTVLAQINTGVASDDGGGDVEIISGGKVEQYTSGSFHEVQGDISITAKTGGIDFDYVPGSSTVSLYHGNVTLNSGDTSDVFFRDSNATNLAEVDIAGNLTLTSGGAITSSGSVIVAGSAELDATGNIILSDLNNNLSSVEIVSGQDVTLLDSDGGLSFEASTISGDLDVTVNEVTADSGNLTQTGSLVVTGSTTLSASHNITLNTAGNDFGTSLSIDDANQVSITNDVSNLVLGESQSDNNFTVVSNGGEISQTGVLNIGGNASFTANGDIISLDEILNVFSGNITVDTSGSSADESGGEVTIYGQSISLLSATTNGNDSGGPTDGGDLNVYVSGSFSTEEDAVINTSANDTGTDGSVSINGDENENIFTLAASVNTWSYESFTLNGMAGADTFNLNNDLNLAVNGFDGTEVTAAANDGGNTFNINADVSGSVDGEGNNDTFNISSSYSATLNGRDGDDFFELQDGGITVAEDTLVGGDGDDTIKGYDDSSEIVGNEWTISTANSGYVVNDSGTVNFSEIENVEGGDQVDVTDDGTDNPTGGIDIFNVNSSFAGRMDGNSGEDKFYFATSAVVITGAGIFGGDGDDEFYLQTDDVSIQEDSLIQGGAGSDTIYGYDDAVAAAGNNWELTGPDSGNVSNESQASVVYFSGIETIEGGDEVNTDPGGTDLFAGGTDDFTLSADFTGTIHANSGYDSILVSEARIYDVSLDGALALDGSAVDISDIEAIKNDGSAEGFGLRLSDLDTPAGVTNTWTISGANTGSVTDSSSSIDFEGFEALYGNNANDTFEFSASTSVVNRIEGGEGINSVDFRTGVAGAGGDRDIFIVDAGSDITESFELAEIDWLVGDSTTTNSITIVSSNNFNWYVQAYDNTSPLDTDPTVDGVNDGQVALRVNASTETSLFNFVDFENITGGSGNDYFTIGNHASDVYGLTGTISGGDGVDRITGRNVEVDWTIQQDAEGYAVGSFTNEIAAGSTSFNQIEYIQAGSAIDDFDLTTVTDVENANFNIVLNGGSAIDTIDLPAGGVSITIGEDYEGLSLVSIEDITADATAIADNHLYFFSGAGENVEWWILNTNSGSVGIVGDDKTVFANFGHLHGGAGNDEFDFTQTGTADEASVLSISGVDDSGLGVEETNTIKGFNQSTTWTVTGDQSGRVAFNVSGGTNYVGSFSGINKLQGGTANDLFVVQAAGDIQEFDGGAGAGTNTLRFGTRTNTNSQWSITTSDTSVERRNTSDNSLISTAEFSNIQSIRGGTGTDIFTIQDINTALGITLNAFSGNDELIVDQADVVGNYVARFDGTDIVVERTYDELGTPTTVDLYTISGVELIDAENTSGMTLVADFGSGSNVWNVTGANIGSLANGTGASAPALDFENIGNLEGSTLADTFTFSVTGSISGALDGVGNSGNSLTLEAAGNTWTLGDAFAGEVDSSDVGSAADFTFSNIQSINGNADTLIGRNQNNHWTIVSQNTGSVVQNVEAPTDSISFSGMSNLWGNAGQDDFTLNTGGSVTGEIRGTASAITDGTSPDSITVLSLGTATVNWTVGSTSSSVDRVTAGIYSFENYTGGEGDDNFTISADFNQIEGAAGDDTFTLSATGLDGSIYGNASGDTNLGADTLEGAETGTVAWELTDAFEGTYTNGGTVNFEQISTLNGRSSGNDQLTGRSQANDWVINNGVGTVNADGSTADRVSFSGMDEFVGRDFVDDFTLTGAFGNVVGAGAKDIFRLAAAASGTIYGESALASPGADNVIYGATSGTTEWQLNDATAHAGEISNGGNSVTFAQVNELRGRSSADIIIARDQANDWMINDTASTVQSSSSAADQVTFYSMETKRGGDQIDEFTINQTSFGTIEGAGNSDVFILNAGGISGNIFGDVTGGSIGSTDSITGFTSGETVWTLNNANAGTVTNGGGTVAFSQIRTLNGNSTENDVIIGRNQENSWAISATNTVNQYENTADRVTFTGMDVIRGNAQVDHFNVSQSFGKIEGAGASDIFTMMASGIVGTLYGGLEGGTDDADDVLNGSTTGANEWSITGPNSGELTNGASDETITFYQIGSFGGNSGVDIFNLNADFGTIEGGLGEDVFNILAEGIEGTIYGEFEDSGIATDNVINGYDSSNSWLITGVHEGTLTNSGKTITFYQVDTLNGGDGSDQLTARSQSNTWEIGADNGTVNLQDNTADQMTFTSMETMVGGSGTDVFNVRADFGKIFGGNGSDLFYIHEAGITGTIYGQDELAVTNTYTDKLYGDDQGVNQFTITGAQQGTLTNGEVVSFYQVGQLEGRSSSDSLVARNQENTWEINASTANSSVNLKDDTADRMVFVSMETKVGGSGIDTFNINADFNTFEGGAGSDVFNVLVADLNGTIYGGTNAAAETTGNIINAYSNAASTFVINSVLESGEGEVFLRDIHTYNAAEFGDTKDNIQGLNQNNDWRITGDGVGTVTAADGTVVSFTNIEKLSGGTHNDIFYFEAGGLVDNIVAGIYSGGTEVAGAINTVVSRPGVINEWELEPGNSSLFNLRVAGEDDWYADDFSGIQVLQGNGDDIIEVITGAYAFTWNITGEGSGTVAADGRTYNFSGMRHIIGSSGSDTFNFFAGEDLESGGAILGLIDGNTGENTIVGRNAQTLWTLLDSDDVNGDYLNITLTDISEVDSGEAGYVYVKTVERITGIAGYSDESGHDGFNDFLVGVDSSTEWDVTGQNSGSIDVAGVSNDLTFDGIENLEGGAGIDAFVFSTINSSISGLVDGGESAAGDPEPAGDTLTLSGLTNGVIVELGPNPVFSAEPQFGRNIDTVVNANNFETIIGAERTNDQEIDQWVTITHSNDVKWDFTVGMDNDAIINEGYVEEYEPGTDFSVLIENSRVELFNFGSLQGGAGDENKVNVETGNSISGEHVPGSGLQDIEFSGSGFYVVDVDENLRSVQGNNNILIRLVDGTLYNFDTSILINDENAGTFTVDTDAVEDLVITFTGINQFETGNGDDQFIFENDGELTNGSINGGEGLNEIIARTLNVDIAFGLSEVSTTAVRPANGSYPNAGSMPDVYRVLQRDEDDGITEIANVTELNVDATSDVSLYSGESGLYVWNIGEEVDAEGGAEIQNTIERNSITELQFSGINAVFGGNADNEFNLFLLSEVSNVITGGSAGTDTVNLQNIVGDLDISVDTPAVSPDMDIYLAGIEQVNLAEGSHTLFGRTYEVGDFDASVPETYTNYWNLSGQSSGSLLYSNRSQTLSFNNVVHLVGGNYQDEFVVTGAAISDWGTIDAGDNALGQDTLTVGADIPLTARLHELVAGDRIVDSSESSYLDVANFESLTANAAISTGVNTLIGIESNAWIIRATGNSVNGIEFENFDNLTGGAGQDQFVFNNALIAGVVDGGLNTVDAVDTVNITNQDNVLVQLGDEAVGDLNLIGIESINATGTGHTLAGENIDNEWKIDTANTGTVNTETAFEGFANLTGGSANDDFIFASTGSLSGIIDGGTNGEDTVALTNITSSLVVSLDQTLTSADLRIQNIDELVANDDATLSNELVAANQENAWIINGRNAGELNGMAFSGFSNLTGNGNVDEFFFDQFTTSIHDVITGVIDGAGNSDIVDTTGVTNDLVIALHDDLDVTADLHLVSIEDVNANTDLQTTNELIGGNANNTWEIDEVNAGTVGTTSFEGFAILTGGGLNDLFRLDGNDTITGAIRGATGADTLDIENLDDAVTVVIGETNLHVGDLVIDSIETINASDLGNTLVAENANNIWTMQLTDSGLLNSDLGYQVAFNGFANLIGGALQDTFNFNREANRDDILTGYIDAGAGDNDIINIDGLLAFETLALGTVGDINVVNSGTLRAINVETVTATNAPANVNYGLVGDNNKNEWLLDGENSGSLDHIAFSGFSNLTGGSQSDDFILDGNDSVSGVIDGGATQNGFKDTVDVKGLNAGITASFDVAYEADLRVQNIDELHAALSETKDNILVGPNSQTSWVINGENEGSMNGTVFSGFNRLIGREAVDSFAFIGTNSVIENGVEGGDNLDDELDMSESIGEVVVRLGQSMPGGVTGVEKFVGNGDTSTIIATEDTVNNWSISRMNGGTLTNGTDTIEFDAFNFLEGGNTTDNFVISAGGGVTGEISAGNGNDTLTIALPETSSGQVVFNGGAGDDDIVINGGVGATTTTYEANDDNETLFYSTQVDESLITYDVVFKDSESVEDNVNSSLLTILTRNNLEETLTLNGGNLTSTDWFQLSDADSGALTRIEFDNKNSISVEGDNTDTDTLLLDGVLIVNNRFSASDLAVVAVDSDVQIQANRAVFESTDGIGTSENRLGLETGSLQLQNLLGDAYIDHEGHLSFSGVTNPAGVVDIIASGNITSTGVLDSDNAFVLVSEGDITLSQANTLNGSVSLLTDKGVIEFANNDGTQFGNVSADKMTFTVTGNVSDSGVMSISDLVVNADASTAIDLSGSGHSFGQVVVNNANSVNIVNSDTDGMAVVGRGISGDFIAVSQSELNAGTISANNIVLTSNEAAVAIQNAQSAINSIFIEGEGVEIGNSLTVSSNISGNAITVIGNTGAVAIDRAINATNSSTGVSGDIVISGNTISQGNNGLISGENIALAANDDISLAANITAIGDLAIKSENGAINVSSTGATATTFQAQFLTMNAAGQLAVQDIDAERLFFEAGSMLQNGIITLASNEVEPEMSVINLSGQLQTAGSSQIIVDDQSLQINAGSALLNGTLSSQGSLDINLQSSSTIATQIAANDVNIDVASGGLQMQNGSTITAVESAAVSASGNIQLAQVVATAEEGSVQLVSGGAITDSNGDANNVTSYNLDFATESGFGTDTDPLELVIGNLHGINNSGMVNIENTGDVSITALRNNGDIKLYNFTGDVTMVQTTENYDNKQSAIAGTNNAMTAGGVIATRYTTGTITLEVEGDLLATGNRFQFERPDVVADHVNILTEGAFGSIGRPLMLFVRTSGTILPLGRGAKPDCGFNTCPANGFDGIEDLTDTSVFGSVNELLVEVEPIDQVDPAVFTDLRNYSFDDISILMPRDQRYDDDTDEDSYL